MKTALSLFLPVGFAALIALPFDLEIAGSVVFSAGILLLMRADYARRSKPLGSSQPAGKRGESLRLAA